MDKKVEDSIEFFNPICKLESNNYGPFYILKQNNSKKKALVLFPETGYMYWPLLYEAKKGCVKDIFKPSIYGVGYIANAHKKDNKVLYNRWISMLSRCYNSQDPAYKFYGAKGYYVDYRWHSFENYLNDICYLPGYNEMIKNPSEYELDKDILQSNIENKVYSSSTCIWVKKNYNNFYILNSYKNKTSSKYIGVCKDSRGSIPVW